VAPAWNPPEGERKDERGEEEDELAAARRRGAGAGAEACIRRRVMSPCMFRAMVFCGSSCSAASTATVASSSCPSSMQQRARRVHAPRLCGDASASCWFTRLASGPKSPRFANSMACC